MKVIIKNHFIFFNNNTVINIISISKATPPIIIYKIVLLEAVAQALRQSTRRY